MQRRTAPLRLGSFVDNYVGPGMFLAFIVLVVIYAVSAGVYALAMMNNNEYARDRAGIEKIVYSYGSDAKDMTPTGLEKRKELATMIVTLEDISQDKAGTTYLTLSDYQKQQLIEVAKTGKPLDLDTTIWTFDSFLRTMFGTEVLLVIWTVLGFGGIASAASRLSDRSPKHRLADLPWQRRWPYAITLAMGPVAWLAMSLSAIALRTDPVAPEPPPQEPLPDVINNEDIEAQPTEDLNVRDIRYTTAPVAAKAAYTNMRVGGAVSYRLSKIDELDRSIEEEQDEARALAEDLRDTQQKINRLRGERKQLEAALASEAPPVTPQLAREEFDRIAQLPGVIATQVVNDCVRLIVRASYRYEGRVYDLGDWQIDLVPRAYSLETKWLRSGVRPDWDGAYPDYRYGGGFCLGVREDTIREHIAKSQYLEAVAIAIDCLNSVNDDDVHKVPLAFFELVPQEVAHG